VSRPPRPEGPGAIWHLTSRGNERHSIFVDDEDRERLLALLGKVAADFNWLCYAFVLMGNHCHLMAETPEATLSRGMRQLNGVYTLGFNRRHARRREAPLRLDYREPAGCACRRIPRGVVTLGMVAKLGLPETQTQSRVVTGYREITGSAVTRTIPRSCA